MDVIRFRPACGASPEFVQENRVAAGRHAGCRCAACGLTCTVGLGTLVGALVGTEPGQ